MDNLHGSNHQDKDAEEIPSDFQCCVCLDLFHKPVVLACGHIACFWCVFRAMKSAQTSHCMVCRHPFNHFPRVCKLLHYLLLNLYPLAYKRRERQVSETEEKLGYVSPQFENYSAESLNFEGIARESISLPRPVKNVPKSGTCGTGEVPLTMVSPIEYRSGSLSILKHETTSILNTRGRIATENGGKNGPCEPVTGYSCSLCKQLLCQPVVLNCGDVFCEQCVMDPCIGVNKCPVCDIPHPSGLPNVCLVLDHFLEERFPEEYEARKRSLSKQVNSQQVNQSTGSDNQMEAAQSSSTPTSYFISWLSGLGRQVHLGIGCDYCGMYPITGKRYKCKDCVEKIGFDLCGQCYSVSGKLIPGRFNQQHKENHEFTNVEAPTFNDRLVLQRREAESSSFNGADQAIVLVEEVVQEEEEEEEEEELHDDPINQPSSSDNSEHQETSV